MFFKNKPPHTRWVSSYMNQDLIRITTFSGYRRSAYDPEGYQFVFAPSVDDATLGEAVIKALSKSRMIKEKDFTTFFDYKRIEKYYKDWIAYCQKTYGYKTKKAMFKHMDHCSITSENGEITIEPWHHEKIEAWGETKNGDLDNVIIPADSNAEEVGKALKLAYSRCTTKGF